MCFTKARKFVTIVTCCGLVTASVSGQDPSGRPPEERPVRTLVPPEDTVASPFFTTPDDFYSGSSELHDTLTYDYHRYDPSRRAMYPHATLGNLGSPAKSLYYVSPMTKGLTTGHSAFDLYKFDYDHFRFYETKVALTRLEYSQGLTQNDAILRAQFGRNFDKGINLSLNYQRINQEGQFGSQRAKNTAFGIGVLYRSPKGMLDGIYQYLSNSIVHMDNGGVDDVEFWLDSIPLPVNVPVRLEGAGTTHRLRELRVQHHLHLFSPERDSVLRKAQVDIIHTFNIGAGFIKFADAQLTSAESAYYDSFVTDDRGIRNFISTETLDNSIDFQFRYFTKAQGIPAHLLRAGLQLRHTTLNQEPDESKVTELFLNARGRLGISQKISLDGSGYFGFLDAAGEYRLEANARLHLFKDAITSAQLNLYQRNPTLIEKKLYIDQIPVWNTDFKNVASSSLQFYYDHPSLRLRLHGGLHVISNLIYFDAARMPQQVDQSVELLQMSASKEFIFGPLGILGHLMLQQYDQNQIALPHLIFNGQMFFTGKLFRKNLLVRTGLDLLVTDAYNGSSYFPVTGQFYYSDHFRITQYPAVDFFFSMQVQSEFKAFFKMENVTSYFSEDHFVQIYDYPQFEEYFRLGLWMKLSN